MIFPRSLLRRSCWHTPLTSPIVRYCVSGVLLGTFYNCVVAQCYVGSISSNVHQRGLVPLPGLTLGHTTLVGSYKLPLVQYTSIGLVVAYGFQQVRTTSNSIPTTWFRYTSCHYHHWAPASFELASYFWDSRSCKYHMQCRPLLPLSFRYHVHH